MLIKYSLFMLPAILIWIIIRGIMLFKKIKRKVQINFKRELLINLIYVYILCLISMTMFPIQILNENINGYNAKPHISIIPAVTIINDIKLINTDGATATYRIRGLLKNILGNLILLIPLSAILPLISNKFRDFKKCLLLGIVTSCTIEVLQYVENYLGVGMGRATDINDVIFNTIGVVIGYAIFKFFIKNNENIINNDHQ